MAQSPSWEVSSTQSRNTTHFMELKSLLCR